jgi:predicted phosphodiesterase
VRAVRVAAISDIHGNLPALEAVLAEIDRETVDAIVVVGDLVTGPASVEVFDRLAGLSTTVHFVHGNADRLVVEFEGEDNFGVDWSSERARLGDDRVAAIADWPLTVGLDVDGLGRVLFCHAIPTADEPIFTRITPDDEVEAMFGETDANVVAVGHTHMQFDRRLAGGLRVVNVGSVGMPYEGRPGAYWALLGPDVELKRTEYDVEQAAGAVREATPDDEDAVRRLLEPPGPDEATAYFESHRGS